MHEPGFEIIRFQFSPVKILVDLKRMRRSFSSLNLTQLRNYSIIVISLDNNGYNKIK